MTVIDLSFMLVNAAPVSLCGALMLPHLAADVLLW